MKQLNGTARYRPVFSVSTGRQCLIGGLARRAFKALFGALGDDVRKRALRSQWCAGWVRIRTARRGEEIRGSYDLTRLFGRPRRKSGSDHWSSNGPAPRCPSSNLLAVALFTLSSAAVNVVIKEIQAGVPVARIELADAVQMEKDQRYSKAGTCRFRATLWLEFQWN